jgi:hypothetical protein
MNIPVGDLILAGILCMLAGVALAFAIRHRK